MADQDPYAAIAQPSTSTDPYAAIATPTEPQQPARDPYADHAQPITQPINPHAVQPSPAPVPQQVPDKFSGLKTAPTLDSILPEWAKQPILPMITKPLGIAMDTVDDYLSGRSPEQGSNFRAQGVAAQSAADKKYPIVAGVNQGIGDVVTSQTSPENMALLAFAPESKLLSGIFAAQAAKGSYDSAQAAYAAYKTGNNQEAARQATAAVTGGAMAGLAGAHAVRGSHAPAPVPQADPLQTGMKYIAAVKSGAPPAQAAAALNMTPEHQEMAHVAEAIIPKTMAEAAKASQPPPPRSTAPQPPPRPVAPPDGATVQAQQQARTITETAARAQQIESQATKIAMGIPPPKPPEVPMPKGMDKGALTQDTINRTAQLIRTLPEDQRPAAQREAVGSLARWGFEAKTPVGPDGKLVNIDSPKGAQAWAVDTINNEVDRQQQAAQVKSDAAQKQADEQAKQQQEDAETARQEREQAAADAAAAKGPEPMPDTPQYNAVRQALAATSSDMPADKLDLVARKAGAAAKILLTPEARQSLVQEHIATRAQQESAAVTRGSNTAERDANQHPVALQKWAADVAEGDTAYMHVAPDTKFKPDGLGSKDGFTKTTVKKAAVEGFNGTYFHPKEIKNSDLRAAAESDNPAAALQQLEADWKAKILPEEQVRPVLSDSVEQTQLGSPTSNQPLFGIDGKETQVLTSSRKLPARYRLAEADSLIPSHNAHSFAPDERYPKGVQERDYEKSKEAQARVISQGQQYDPAYTVNTNPDTVNGPPVVTPDGVVLGGNSRTMSTQRMYAETDGAGYRQALRDQAGQFGLKPEQVDQMKKPVLVRQVDAPKDLEDARRLGSEMNKSMTGALGVSERAVSAGKNIKPETLTKISDMLSADDSTLRELMGRRGPELLRMMVDDGVITERERPQFVDASGELSDEGKTFIERALLGSVVGDSQLLDAAPKGILAKLERSLGSISSFSARPDRWNIVPALREAIAEHVSIARSGSSVQDHINQTSMFGPERNPLVDAIVTKLSEKPNAVKDAFSKYGEDSDGNAPGQSRMFGGGESFDAFNHAFGSNLSEEQFHDGLTAAAKVEPAQEVSQRGEGGQGGPEVPGGQAGTEAPADDKGAPGPETVAKSDARSPSNTFYSNPLDPELMKRYIGEPLLKMAEPLRTELEAHGKIADVANSVHDLLQNLDRTNKATTLEAKALTGAMEKAGFSLEDGAEVFKHLEDPNVPLTDKQIELRDQWIKPLNQSTKMQYIITELIKSGKFDLDDIMRGKVPPEEIAKIVSDQDEYQHRIPVEKDTFVDKLLGDSLKRFRAGGGALSRVFPSAKRSIFKEIHGPEGEREVVAVKNGRVTQFINKDNAGALDDQIAEADKNLQSARSSEEPEPSRIDALKAKVDELNSKKQQIADEGHTVVDMGEHLGGYVTTKELADQAVAPLESKLTAMKTEFQTLHGSQNRAIASQQRIENLYYQIDATEKQIAAVRASIGPEEEAAQGMTRQEALAERVKPLQDQIKSLTEKQADLAGRATNTRWGERQLKSLPGRIDDLNVRIAAISDEMAGAGLEGKYWQDKNGGLWKFDRGTTEFISDKTGQQYHADARLAGLVNYMETNKAMNAAVVLERAKGLLEDNGMGRKIEKTKDVPEGWKPTSLRQMQGYYFPAYIADAFDQFDYLQSRGAPNVLEKANNFVIQSVLMNPLAHGINIASNWFTGRAASALAGSGVSHKWYVDNVKAGTEAINVLKNMGGDEYQRLLRLGLDLRGADTSFDSRTKDILRSFTDQLGEEKESNKLMSALVGVKDAAHFLQQKNHQITFGLGDLALTQAFYAKRAELIRAGVPNAEEGARDWAHKMVGEYTTPIRLAGNAGLGRLAENPMAQSFFRYHFGYILRPIADSIRESLGEFKPNEQASEAAGKEVNKFGQSPAAARSTAIARLVVMTAMATYVFPKILDPVAKKITGDDRATAPRGGLLKFASDAYETATGERSIPSLASSVFTPGLGTMKALELFTNRDNFSGKHIYGSDQDMEGKAKQMGAWLAKGTFPGQLAGRADQGNLRQVVEGLAGIHFPIEHGLKAAAEIRRDEGGSNPSDPQASRVFQSIMAAAAQAHRTNGQDTSVGDALFASGKLSKGQEKTLELAISEPPIVFAVHGLEHPQDVYRVFQHSTDEEKRDLLDSSESNKKMYQYEEQLREQGNDSEADKVLAEITRR